MEKLDKKENIIKDSKEKVVAYIRDNKSYDNNYKKIQEQKLYKYCEEKNYELIKIFYDVETTQETIPENYTEMFWDITEGNIKKIITVDCYELFVLRGMHLLFLIGALAVNDCKIEFIDDELDEFCYSTYLFSKYIKKCKKTQRN